MVGRESLHSQVLLKVNDSPRFPTLESLTDHIPIVRFAALTKRSFEYSLCRSASLVRPAV